jgi:hypothetical protein
MSTDIASPPDLAVDKYSQAGERLLGRNRAGG